MAKPKIVYLMYTRNHTDLVLMQIYSKTAYQKAYNRLADIGDRHGVRVQSGTGNIAVHVHNESNTQQWWLERHEVIS